MRKLHALLSTPKNASRFRKTFGRQFHLCTLATFSIISSAASAAPSAYVTKFGALNITNHTNSSLLRDTESPNKVWVLPPGAGLTAVKGFSASANNTFCGGLKEIALASNDIIKRVGRLREQVLNLRPELEDAERKLLAAREHHANFANSVAIEQITELRDTIARLEKSKAEAISALEGCQSSCNELAQENRRLSDEIRSHKGRLWALEDEHRATVYAFKKSEHAVQMARDNYDEVGARIGKLRAMYLALDDKLLEMYGRRGKLEGGTAYIDYETGWAKNVQNLEANYSSYDFTMIPTHNVRIFANWAGSSNQDTYFESLPALLDYSINGVKFEPWGERSLEQASLPNVLTGNVRLSLIGSCPLVDTSFFQNIPNFTPSTDAEGKPLYSISATYEYPSAFKYHVKASYNLYKFYELIKKNSTSGGFFSSSSYSSVAEERRDSDAFSIEIMKESEKPISDEERERIRTEVRSMLIDRVLAMTAEPVPGTGAVGPTPAGLPPERGATVAANGLSAVCGFNLYCQAGSWLLRTGDAIFGSSSSESRFKSTWDRTAREEWSDSKVVLRPGAMSFLR